MKSIVSGIRSVIRGKSGVAATLQTLLVKVFIISINMGTGIITARFLGPDGRGEQAALILWPQFLAFCLTLGLPKALVYNLKRHPDRQTELFSATLLMSSGLGIIATLIGIIFMPQWLSQYPAQTIRMAQWFMLAAPLSLLGIMLTSAFEALNEFTIANQLRYLVPLTTLFALVVLILTQAITPFTVALAYLLPSIPLNIWMLIRLLKRLSLSFSNLGEPSKWLMSYGLRSYGIELLGTLSAQVGQALVVSLLTAASMGLYTVAISLTRILTTFEDAIITVLFPKVSARPLEEVVAITGQATRVSTFVTILAGVPLMVLCPFFLKLLYGAEFLGAVPVFRILVIEALFAGMTWILAQAFLALGRPGTLTILQGIGLGVTVPLMFLFIPEYGLVGAGLALLGSTLVRFVFVWGSYPILLKTSPPNLIITWGDILYLKQKLLKN